MPPPAPETRRSRDVQAARAILEETIWRAGLIVVLLGADGRGLEERRDIARSLNDRGIVALVPEDDFPPDVGPSLSERAILSTADVDLVFLNVQSWGTATEFGQFHSDPQVAGKLRVLVAPAYHPIHGSSDGYLSDLYLTHLVTFGHVYPVDGGTLARIPSAKSLITLLAERDREIRATKRKLTR